MDHTAQDKLWLARALVFTGLVLLALGFGFAFGGALGAFIAAVMVPGVAAVAFGAGIGLLVLRDEQRRSREVDVVNLKAMLGDTITEPGSPSRASIHESDRAAIEKDMDRAFLNVDAWLREVDPEDDDGG
jgi:hypothetical protein